MVAWQRRGGWPPDEQRWPLFVPSEIRGATLGIVGYGSIGRELARMKSSAYLVNVGRGASVDEAALASALRERRLAGAAVDVFGQEPPPAGHPLYALEDVIVSPHVSGFLPSYDDRCTDLFAENLRRYLAGVPLLNVVDRARGH
jgi:phosphoglycerate dehydrogenase-like enzyme